MIEERRVFLKDGRDQIDQMVRHLAKGLNVQIRYKKVVDLNGELLAFVVAEKFSARSTSDATLSLCAYTVGNNLYGFLTSSGGIGGITRMNYGIQERYIDQATTALEEMGFEIYF